MTRPTVSLAIPAFNEERRLPRLLEALATTAERDLADADLAFHEAVVVDDGSTDGTARVLRDDATPRVRQVVYDGANRGKGHAVNLAVQACTGDLVLLTDVDLAAPLAEARQLHDALKGGADVAVGSRALRPEISHTPRHRQLAGRTFNLLVRLITGLRVRDTQCGFKLMRTEVAQQLLREQLTEGYAFDVEVLMRARRAGLRIAEVPVHYEHDDDSRVTVGAAGPKMLAAVLKLAYHLRVRRGRAARRSPDGGTSSADLRGT